MDLRGESEDSFLMALKNDFNSLFEVAGVYNISFIVIANILFVAAIYFVLQYLSSLSLISFDSPLFGDFSSISIGILVLYFLTIVILSPIIEEILFRGMFLRRFNKALNNISLAILLSSILFGICHNFGGILGAILFGICVSILYIKSKNILVPIFAHFLNNLISFLIALSGVECHIQGNLFVIILIIILAFVSNIVLFKAIINEWPSGME
ncbi:MAG: CPBP family intramembrane metalloprotease [Methanobrevibacter sp.]|nr:CPBP family intramembrane metalloprotease [Methanobrevibacter sp.]